MVSIEAGQLKKGMPVMLKDKPCKVLNLTISKTGKHGHAKAHIYGQDVFNISYTHLTLPTIYPV